MPLDPIQVEIPDDGYWHRQIKCQYACPVGTDARGYIRAIANGDFESAYLIARGPNPLASICGRVCGAPCEAACRRGAIDQPVSIRALKRFVTEKFGPESFTDQTLKPIELLKLVLGISSKRECNSQEELSSFTQFLNGFEGLSNHKGKVAIIGSGPAGLAAAHDLALLGIAPTVYEMEPVPAGMLAVGIPEYRLPRKLIEAEVEVIKSLGVEFICNTQVGVDITLEEIRQKHDATIIAIGAKRSRKIPVEGGEGPGVIGGVEFLRDIALKNFDDSSTLKQLGERVIVIGGGNVAYDVSRTVIRQVGFDVSRSVLRQAGVREVHMCCLESVDEMPADDIEIIEGHEEGVTLHTSLGPIGIERNEDQSVSGVRFKRVESVFDESGNFSPQFSEEQVVVEGDTVIWAIGQQADLSLIQENSNIDFNERGAIQNNPETLATTAEDVFVAGDIAYGTRLLIDAVASGKKCARSVYHFLTGETLTRKVEREQVHLLDFTREQDYEKIPRIEVPTLSPTERTQDQSTVVETGFNSIDAVTESQRCLDCGVNTIFDSEKCILCGGCADVCPELCLRLVSCDRLEGSQDLKELLGTRYESENLSEMSAIVKDEERCIRCALCAERCPVDAISMERFCFSGLWNSSSQR